MTTLLISSQICRSCRQVEIFRMDLILLTLGDLAELEPAETMTDITLRWDIGPSIEEALPIVKRWRHLRRLTFSFSLPEGILVPPLKVLSDFILEMKHLSHLHIAPHRYPSTGYGQLEILRDKVNEFILPRRPNFTFDISCWDD
jgi:hypothetical protein